MCYFRSQNRNITMLKVLENFSLKKYNTFGIDAACKYFAAIEDHNDIEAIFANKSIAFKKMFILGGGSNILLREDYDGLIIHPVHETIAIVAETADYTLVNVAAGVEWDSFVAWAVEQNLSGVENLSLIPGCVGAAPVQNIGAYGVEAKDVIEEVEVYHLTDKKRISLSNSDCEFAYRNSVFKHELKDVCVVLNVTFKLLKQHTFNLSYSRIEEEVTSRGPISLRNIRETIIDIRERKLPDHRIMGNAGSFFKNPIVDSAIIDTIRQRFPDLVTFPLEGNKTKVAAGWMIDQLGWKGKSVQGACVHDKQALVLVNKGNASGEDVVKLSEQIKTDVYKNFGIELEPEVIFL